MNSGKETWEWALVVLLLAGFLISAHHAYDKISKQQDFAPPDDWAKGDSWDLEHQSGPGAGQPMQMSEPSYNSNSSPTTSDNTDLSESLTSPEQIIIEDNIDWNQSDANSSKNTNKKAEEKTKTSAIKESKAQQDSGMYEIFTEPAVTEKPASSNESEANSVPVESKEQPKETANIEPANETKTVSETVANEPKKEESSAIVPEPITPNPIEESGENPPKQETPDSAAQSSAQ